ncbi:MULTISPECIES: hypothetical protein [Bradyrhizobium]|uniref:hypothetical protein n=1 Tax=Bradyrhizobium TaxID=374 RepID=UPI000A18ECAD|nr:MULTISPECIES: hypothetical protein [Bradyrhizobium]OSI28784.1 hypothetical protein BST65_09150 [Bradyrhizobium canariense]OSI33758.1 hypothetical protein BST66_12385 [Bradyrhizobium canariense]OSI44712.1 hypothetical protein BSZ20_13835 [Bradyrhizobium canariense]OSI51660.1 hypothetical protein BST67_12175 [Bradyrhizobium canariense]OSI55327.1 hypothetical protein BSZ15_20220 [Bradyrhizobium canariense]
MKRLILTSSSGSGLARSGLAELVISSSFHFEWGPLPSPEKLAAFFAARSANLGPGDHWSDWGIRWPKDIKARKDLSLANFCEQYDVVELWFDPAPRDQLQLVWLLDHLSSCSSLVRKLKLRLVASELTTERGEDLAASEPHIHVVRITAREFETARLAWSAYRATTPEACVDLLHQDLSALLMLRLFHLRSQRRTYVFGEFELGSLLEGLALGPKPVVAGLGDELRTIDRENLRARHEVYLRSRLSLTEFGRAVLAHQEDFSRHNPIDRWWGGTHLTNDRLWRYGNVLTKP